MSRQEPPSRQARERCGRYELVTELASGGMASIFLGRVAGEDGFVRVVAIKRIHPHLAKEGAFVDMFIDEARIAAMIDHPNVCQVIDYGREQGTPFLAMEFLSGEPLSQILRTSPTPPSAAALRLIGWAVADACEGLHAAHELRGADGQPLLVVHRDVSPQNLFVTFEGVVKVVDFGIASAREKVHDTETGEVKGKFAYMALEQMLGGDVDRRADVWALGVVLWESLVGRRLFRRGTQAATISAVQYAEIPAPSSVNPSVTAALDEVCNRALQRDVQGRYETAHEMHVALVEALRSLGEPVRRAELAEWLAGLFPEGKQRRAALFEEASEPSAPAAEPASADETPTVHEKPVTVTPQASPSPPSRGSALRTVVLLLVMGSSIAGGLLAGAFWIGREPPPSPEAPPSSLEPSSAAVDGEPSLEASPVEEPPVAADAGAESEADAAATLPAPRARVRRRRPPAPAHVPTAPPPPEAPSGQGCLEIAIGVAVRVDNGPTIEGPRRCHRVSAGAHTLLHVDRETGAPGARRTVQVPADGSVRVLAP